MYELLVISTSLAFINVFLNNIIKPIISILSNESKFNCKELRNQISDIKEEMISISAKDEFARFARSQRKLNKLQDLLKSEVKLQMESTMKVRLAVTFTFRAILGILSLVLIWCCRHNPVVVFPENWLHPFSTVISWPCNTSGGVGLPIWLFISSSVAKVFQQLFDSKA